MKAENVFTKTGNVVIKTENVFMITYYLLMKQETYL